MLKALTAIAIATFTLTSPVHGQAPVADAQQSADSLMAALRRGDRLALKGLFADTVRFDGESRVVSLNGGTPPVVMPTTATARARKPDWPENFVAVTIPSSDLAAGYARIVEQITPARWSTVLAKVQPTLTLVESDGNPYEHARKGDYVLDLHLREAVKGKRAGLDEAMLFVLRRIGDRYVVVAHWADL